MSWKPASAAAGAAALLVSGAWQIAGHGALAAGWAAWSIGCLLLGVAITLHTRD